MFNVIDDLIERGMLDQFSNREHVEKMLETKQTIYAGFDPSASSLQLGNYVCMTVLRRLQKAGHRIIAIIGGGTGMIGDPSGKKAERKFLSREDVLHNVECIKKQLSKYLDFSSPDKGILLNNGDWWEKTSTIEFLREYGKCFSINYMLDKEIVSSRLESGISFAEFSYMILQSADFYRLYKTYGCKLQVGGGDQWGNLTASMELIRKKEENPEVEVFSFKLITDSEGKKFGKSEKGALYLDPNMRSPYDIYQYFINVSDADVARYMRVFDDRPLSEIQLDIDEHNAHPELRIGQKKLAYRIVSDLHSPKVAEDCKKMSEALFSGDFSQLEQEQLEEIVKDLPRFKVEGESLGVLDALVSSTLAKSKREAREFVSSGSIRVNGNKVDSLDAVLNKEDAYFKKIFIIRRGKKSYGAIEF